MKIRLQVREQRLRLHQSQLRSDDDSEAEFTETWRGQVPPLPSELARREKNPEKKKRSRRDNVPEQFLLQDAEEKRELEENKDLESYLFPPVAPRELYERQRDAPPPKKRAKRSKARLTMNDANFQDYDLVLDNDVSLSDLEGSLMDG